MRLGRGCRRAVASGRPIAGSPGYRAGGERRPPGPAARRPPDAPQRAGRTPSPRSSSCGASGLTGPAIARRLGRPRSTVGGLLRRLGLGRLAALEPKPRGHPLRARAARRTDPHRHQEARPDRRHRPPHHRRPARPEQPCAATGWEALHVAIDDASRLAYTEILPDERRTSATAFLERALGLFERHGVTVERVMTDNGSAYKSHALPRRARSIAASATSEPGPTRHAPTARPSASSRPACANGPMPAPSRPRPSAPPPCSPGSTTTTPPATSAASAVSHPSLG